ncbi:MAG: signal peptidase I [Clostridiales Family XIII bacterium]|jgi:signal peptidase|nr:signal peptidase I [Clostridiales Family XIII bacterium]
MADKAYSAAQIQRMLNELDNLRLTHRRMLNGAGSGADASPPESESAFGTVGSVPETNPAEIVPAPDETGSFQPASQKSQSFFGRIWVSPVTGAIVYTALALIVATAFLSKDAGIAAPPPRNFLGFSAFTVLTSSMQSEIPRGSFVLVRHVDPDGLQIGDDITYLKSNDTTFTHRITAIFEDYYEGRRGFATQGVDNSAPDRETVIADNIVGKVIFHNLTMGKLLSFVRAHLLLCGLNAAMIPGLFAALRMVFPAGRSANGRTQTQNGAEPGTPVHRSGSPAYDSEKPRGRLRRIFFVQEARAGPP